MASGIVPGVHTIKEPRPHNRGRRPPITASQLEPRLTRPLEPLFEKSRYLTELCLPGAARTLIATSDTTDTADIGHPLHANSYMPTGPRHAAQQPSQTATWYRVSTISVKFLSGNF
ncbi:hypothetical protein J6590_032374 [Homalodisca vitripennis]|nr:hypothetical protein J6590_032374 [Homalodisca vitripennis]